MSEFDQNKALEAISERFTPAMRAEMATNNAAFRNRIDPDSFAERTARARQQMVNILEQIDQLNTLPESPVRQDRLSNAQNRLTELLAEAGEPELAAEIATDPDQKAYFAGIAEAIERPDEEICACEDERIVDRKKNIDGKVPVRIIATEVPSRDHNRNLILTKCSKCGFLNAR